MFTNQITTKIAAVAFTAIVNAALAVAVVGLFDSDVNSTAASAQVAKVEQITIVAKRA